MKRPESSYHYQEQFWPTLESIETLVERWRMWQTGRGAALSRDENLAFWSWAHHIVAHQSTRHFGRSQVGDAAWYDAAGESHHARRLDAFMRLLVDPRYTWPRNGEHRSPGWLVQAYRRRFPELETLGELGDYGISTAKPLWDENDGFLGYADEGDKYMAIRHWNEAARVDRLRLQRNEGIEGLKDAWTDDRVARGEKITEQRWQNFRRRYARYLALRQLRHNDVDATAEFLPQVNFFED